MSVVTSMTLLSRIRDSDDAAAWDEFHSLYYPLLENFFFSNGISKEDAADVSQEVLRRIARAAPDFRYDPSKGKFRSWLFRIARNEMNRHFAKSAKRREREIPMWDVPESVEKCELEKIWDREYRERAFAYAAERVRPTVSESAWAVFIKTVVEGHTPQDVADELEIAIGTVYISKSRVIARLRECVASISGEPNEFDG